MSDSPTMMFAMQRTALGSSLLDFIEGVSSGSETQRRGGLRVAFLPASPGSHDLRAIEELAVGAMSVRRRVAVLHLDAAIAPPKGKGSEAEALEPYLSDAPGAAVLPRERQIVLVASGAPPGTTNEITARAVNGLLARLQEHYDLVLVVAPNPLTSNLGAAVAGICDQCYLFVRQQSTTQAVLAKVRERLAVSGTSVDGIVYTGRRRLIPESIYRLLFGAGTRKR
jgi:hypothetical protein